MIFDPTMQDWQVLGLTPGAELREVHRSYRERKALYAPDTAATYSLLEEDERAQLLQRIEEAYRRIIGAPAEAYRSVDASDEIPEVPAGPPPAVNEEPGAHLRHHRLRSSLTLAQVATETKIRASLLAKIESEDFEFLPAPVYVRGFVLQYAQLLGLADAEGLTATYLHKMMAEQVRSE